VVVLDVAAKIKKKRATPHKEGLLPTMQIQR